LFFGKEKGRGRHNEEKKGRGTILPGVERKFALKGKLHWGGKALCRRKKRDDKKGGGRGGVGNGEVTKREKWALGVPIKHRVLFHGD